MQLWVLSSVFHLLFCKCWLDFLSKSQLTTIWEQLVSSLGVWSQPRAIVLFPGLSVRSDGSCFLLLSDPFGKRDEREPLTNAIQSDSAVIGGKPFLVDESRKGTSISVLWRSVLNPSLMPSSTQDPRVPASPWAFSQTVLCAVWRQQLHGCTTDAPHPDPQAADYWLNSWIIYLETGSVHFIHLIQVSILLKHKPSNPVKLRMEKGHTGADRWGKLHPVGFAP